MKVRYLSKLLRREVEIEGAPYRLIALGLVSLTLAGLPLNPELELPLRVLLILQILISESLNDVESV